MMGLIKQIAATAALGLGLSSVASAGVLYATTNAGSGSLSQLLTIDLTDGSTTVVGDIGYTVNGLTWDATTGTLYGSARADEGLLTINTTTGAGSLVGAFNSSASGCSSRNVLLAANAGGDLFGWCDPSSDDLMSIDKGTGQATLIGESGLSTATHGMAFDALGNLYLNQGGSIYTIDTTTGQATFVASNSSTYGHHGDFNPDDGLYYGIGDFGASGVISVWDLGVGNALQSTIALDRDDVFTLAFEKGRIIDPPATGVPVPATLLLLGLGLVGIGAARRRAS